jgi:alpha-ketoglutarate-dependent taurine dioxygenase
LPLGVGPQRIADAAALAHWLAEHHDWVQTALHRHGAVLFRGFAAVDAPQFEAVARAIAPGLQSQYLGTSPRVNLTPYVFTASELPGFYPIPQHAEMSFLAEPPRQLFFCALQAPAQHGETPICDLRAVWRALDPAVRDRFDRLGLRIIRNYAGPDAAQRDLWQLKRWDQIFGTTDRDDVQTICAREGFAATWGDQGQLTLTSHQPAARAHPETAEMAWLNHSQVFHLLAGPEELRRIATWRPGLRSIATWLYAETAIALRRLRTADHQQPMHCTYGDGSPIRRGDLAHVLDVVWRHLVVIPWQTGDMLALDNRLVSHGRLPYRGPRTVAVAFA